MLWIGGDEVDSGGDLLVRRSVVVVVVVVCDPDARP